MNSHNSSQLNDYPTKFNFIHYIKDSTSINNDKKNCFCSDLKKKIYIYIQYVLDTLLAALYILYTVFAVLREMFEEINCLFNKINF